MANADEFAAARRPYPGRCRIILPVRGATADLEVARDLVGEPLAKPRRRLSWIVEPEARRPGALAAGRPGRRRNDGRYRCRRRWRNLLVSGDPAHVVFAG